MPRGNFNGTGKNQGKLTAAKARAIFLDPRRYKAIAAEYGISVPLICNIKYRKCWKGATEDLEPSLWYNREDRKGRKLNAQQAREIFSAALPFVRWPRSTVFPLDQ